MNDERTEHPGADLRSVLAVVLLLAVGVFVASYLMRQRTVEYGSGTPTVAATVFPLYDIVRNITGDTVEVVLILPPGASPHTFEPSPSIMIAAQKADVTYAIGHGLDDWVDPLIHGGSSTKVIVDHGIGIIEHDEGGEEADDRHHDGGNPHYWLDVTNAMIVAQTVADDLEHRYPASADVFSVNLTRYLDALTVLDQEVRTILKAAPTDRMVTLHDAWDYFASAYDMEMVGSFEPSPGKVPTPKYLAELSDAVRSTGVTTLFSEPQLATETIEPFLDDLGLELRILDPLGGVSGRESYAEMMRYNARTIRDAR